MDSAIVFEGRRLLVGWSLKDWSPVWYEPVGSKDGDGPKYDANGGAEIGLYLQSTGDPQYREPMFGQVAWFPPFDYKTFETTENREKKPLQQQFLADAYKYLSTDDRRAERSMEKDFLRGHDTRRYKFFEAAKLYKRRKRQARSSAGTAGAAAAEQEQEEALSEDSGFESNIGQYPRPRADTEMPPPPPPPTARRNAAAQNPRTGSSSKISGKRKRETPPKQRHQEDQAPQSFGAGDSGRDHTRHNSVSLMSGGLGRRSRTVSPLFMGDASSILQNRRSNNFAFNSTEETEYEDDYVLSRRPSESLRNGSVPQHPHSTRFSSPVEAGQEHDAPLPPYQDYRPSSVWGDVEGATASKIGRRAMSYPRSEPATTGYVSANYFANKRGATEVDNEDYKDYNMGLSYKDALKRAKRESAAIESRTNTTTGHGNGMSDNSGHIPEDIYPSIEDEDEEDKLWEE
ncbi:hypothetical protein NU219Hw_g8031t1 [Hortaea werneckii]